MNNLDKAINNLTDKEANKIYRQCKKATSDSDYNDSLSSIIYDAVKKIGGYSNGSDIYDNSDTAFAMDLLGIGSSSEWSMDYDNIQQIKESYANHVNGEMAEFDLASLKSFKEFYKEVTDKDAYDGTVEELAEIFKKASDFASDVYEQLNQPRG